MERISEIENISIVILTYNEENNITRVLQSCILFSEIIILDSFSDDNTIALTQKFDNVKIYYRKFDTHANQWNYAISCSSNNYVLCLDADYILSDLIVSRLKKLTLNYDAYYARFEYVVLGKRIFGNIYPPKIVLFDKSVHNFYQDGHTQAIKYDGPVKYLKGKIIHDDRKKIERWLKSQVKYANLENDKLVLNSSLTLKDYVRKKTLLTPIIIFIYVLFFKLNILSGKSGIYYAYQRVYAEILLLLKLNEKK